MNEDERLYLKHWEEDAVRELTLNEIHGPTLLTELRRFASPGPEECPFSA